MTTKLAVDRVLAATLANVGIGLGVLSLEGGPIQSEQVHACADGHGVIDNGYA